ncbi:MAG TPA: hypothetical protein PK971_04540, partial [Saprospiraceae bacterium]|nr:hypothetical protein [Saprospiraceae bacterium]
WAQFFYPFQYPRHFTLPCQASQVAHVSARSRSQEALGSQKPSLKFGGGRFKAAVSDMKVE